MAKILLLNGPNLDLLGAREPERYGRESLAEIVARLEGEARVRGHALLHFQSNSESALIERIHAARGEEIAIALINAAAFTHTSIALRDALLAAPLPFIEIHLSNIYARESFRRRSLLSDIAQGVLVGLGPQGYSLALKAAMDTLERPASPGD